MGIEENKTIPLKGTEKRRKRRCRKCSASKAKVSRINCWGSREVLDAESVDESIATEEAHNKELDAYLEAIKGK